MPQNPTVTRRWEVHGTRTARPHQAAASTGTDLTIHDLARCALSAGDRALDGYVATFVDGTMTIRTESGVVGGFRAGDEVEVRVLDEVRGEVQYSGWVTKVRPTTVLVSDLELTSVLQKRHVPRVRIRQSCSGVVDQDGVSRSMTFVVLDIGAQGMRITAAEGLTAADRIAFRFPTTNRDVPLVAEVLRSHKTPSGSTQYGCRFVGVHESDTDALFRYVLLTQGAQRRARLH
jgi:hypothetical protein